MKLRLGTVALLVLIAILLASRWVGHRPYITPGTHQVFHMDSSVGALLEFLVILVLVITGAMTLAKVPRAGRLFTGIAISYVGAIAVVSLLTPRTIVNIGDSYCWDMWCFGIEEVNAAPQGPNILYTAQVALFADSSDAQRLPVDSRGKQFFYALDEQGRRFPVSFRPSSVIADITVQPGESVKSTLSFVAPANARNLYLTGDVAAPSWVRLYFGSDLNPFHRRTLLRVVAAS